MNTLTVVAFACLAVFCAAKPSGHGVVVSGPSGVVTDHGPVVAPSWGHDGGHWGHGDDGSWGGHDDGHWDDGSWGGHDDGSWDDGSWGHGGHSNVVHGNGATLVGPAVGHSVVHGPVAGGAWAGHGGAWAGHGGWGGAGAWGGYGHGHGVVVRGPHTVPATIVGPAGKVHAVGLWGPTHAHGGGHGGHHW